MHILLLHLGNILTAPRPGRMLEVCRELNCCISYMGSKSGYIDDAVHRYELPPLPQSIASRSMRKLIAFMGSILSLVSIDTEPFYSRMFGYGDHVNSLSNQNYDLIIVENLELLPLAFKIRNGAKILFDAREYYPREFDDSFVWKVIHKASSTNVCKKYLKQCDAVCTVSPGLLKEYKKEFGIKPVLIRSMPHYQNLSVQPIKDNNIKVVHHGAAHPDRKLEVMIDAFEYVDARFILDFYLTGSDSYIESLKKLACKNHKIRFIPPVPYKNIAHMLNSYDIGFYLLSPSNFNTRHALPNKFFEFIQSRLAVFIGPSPDMSDIIRQYQCGAVADNFDPKVMADLFNKQSADDILKFKMASDVASKDLCYEEEQKKLREILEEL